MGGCTVNVLFSVLSDVSTIRTLTVEWVECTVNVLFSVLSKMPIIR